MARLVKTGSTSRKVELTAWDATTGLPYLTAAFGDAGISLWYRRGTAGAIVAITPATQTIAGAWSSGGFVLTQASNNSYRLDVPDAAFAAGVDEVVIGGIATAWKLIPVTVQLVGYDPRTDAVATVAGSLDTNVKQWSGTAIGGVDTAGYPKVTIKDGTGAGEIDTNAGAVVSVTTVGTLTTYTGNTPQTGDSFARIGAAGAGLTAAGLTQANVRTAVGLATANLDTQLDALPTNAELATALGGADDAVLAAIAALNNLSSAGAQAAAAAALVAYGASTYAGGDTPGTATLLTRIIGTLLVGNHSPQSGDAFARVGVDGAGLTAVDDATLAAIAALNNLSSAQAQAAALAANVAYDAAVPADLAGLSTLTAAQVWAAITATAANIIADHVIRRKAANVFASANGDAMDDAASLLGVIQRGDHADTTTNPGFLTVFDPDGGELAQIALTADAGADPTVALG